MLYEDTSKPVPMLSEIQTSTKPPKPSKDSILSQEEVLPRDESKLSQETKLSDETVKEATEKAEGKLPETKSKEGNGKRNGMDTFQHL